MTSIPHPTPASRPRNPLRAWFDVRFRHLESWAFALNRLTAIGLTVYLFLHLAVLSILTRGPEAWDAFVALARTPLFLMLDVVLIFGILFHGLNSLRVALVGRGIGVSSQRVMLWISIVTSGVLLIVSTWLVFTK